VGTGADGWRDKAAYLKFVARGVSLARRLRPDVIIGYDQFGFVASSIARRSAPNARLVYHCFDFDPNAPLGAFSRRLRQWETAAVRLADCTIVSSAGRAPEFQRFFGCRSAPLVVMNCQRREQERRVTGELGRLLAERNLAWDRTVCRLGFLTPHNAIETTIRAAALWSGNWGLVLAGAPRDGYLEALEALVRAEGVEDRVLILPRVPYELWYDCLYSSDLGVALYEPTNLSNETMAGAGNKLNLYLQACIPSIVPDIPDFVDFVRRYGAATVADASSPASVAAAVTATLLDPVTYRMHQEGARRAFEEEFNFETQYAPVLAALDRSRSRG